MQFFQTLGALVERHWRDKNYNEAAFPDIAAQALAEKDAIKMVSPWDIIQGLFTETDLPRQRRDEFGDLAIVVHQGERFRIDVYFWLDGTTSIHQHGFSGAFQVLLGSSIHSLYTFQEDQKINAHFSTGQLVLNAVQLLEKGSIREIFSGRGLVHSLFHLDRPSVTLTVRSTQDQESLPQYDYLKPFFAVDPFFNEPSMLRRIQGALLLLRMDHSEADSIIGELIDTADFHTTFAVLNTIFQFLVAARRDRTLRPVDESQHTRNPADEKARLQKYFDRARCRHGHLVDLIPPVLEEMQRQNRLIDLRKHITSSQHRFFLALLLNVSDRILLLDLVRQRFPNKNPVDTVCNWVQELSSIKSLALQEPNVLGLSDFSDFHLRVLRYLLGNLSEAQMKRALKEDSESSGDARFGLEKVIGSFRNSIVLKPLLDDRSSTINIDGAPPFDAPR